MRFPDSLELVLAFDDVERAVISNGRHCQVHQRSEGCFVVERCAEDTARLCQQRGAPLRVLGLRAGRLFVRECVSLLFGLSASRYVSEAPDSADGNVVDALRLRVTLEGAAVF